MAWQSTTGVFDFVRSPEAGAPKFYGSFEIEDSSGRVFAVADLDARTVCAVVLSDADYEINKGSEDDPVVGFVEDISQDAAVASVLLFGISDDVNYSETATEDPDRGDRIVTDGDGECKQTPDSASTGAGSRPVGRGYVLTKDTTNKMVRILWP